MHGRWASDFGCSWVSDFTITDLILGIKSNLHPGFRDLKLNKGYNDMENLCAHCRRLIEREKLDQSLQRLRIEHIDFYEDLIGGNF